MGGELSIKDSKAKKHQIIKSPLRNRSSIEEEQKQNSMSASNIETKARRKKEKIQIIAKNKKTSNQEKKALELIHKNNKNKEDYEMIYNIIDKHFFMQTLNDQARNEIIITMSLCKVKEGTTLFTQGSIGNYWYIIHDGKFSLYIDNILKKELKRGDSFGEYALMNNSPRSATVKAITDCEVWVMKREVFRKILDYLFTLNYDENMKFLNSINLPLDSTFKSILANNLIQEMYKEGEYICKEGELGNCMYIIKDGDVDCCKNGKIIRTLKKGDNFGQKAILEENKRTLDVIAKSDCILYSISVEFFKNQIGIDYKESLYFSFINYSFQNSKFFTDIYPKMLEKVFGYFEFLDYKGKEVVFEKGTSLSNKLIIVLEGGLMNKITGTFEAKRYEFLFEKELYENLPIVINQDLIAEPDCFIAQIDYVKFQEVLGGNIQNIQNKSKQQHSFDQIALFKNLSEDKLEILQSKLKIEKFDNGRKIISQGEIGD